MLEIEWICMSCSKTPLISQSDRSAPQAVISAPTDALGLALLRFHLNRNRLRLSRTLPVRPPLPPLMPPCQPLPLLEEVRKRWPG